MENSYIAMNYKCNHNCMCCPLSTFDKLHKGLDYKKLKQQILELKEKNGENIHFTISGGEPTIDKNFLDLMKILGEFNPHITILSNASSCKDKEFVKRMIDSLGENYDLKKLDYVTAIHSSNPKIHDSITGVEGSFKETMNGLENLSEFYINTTIKHIMNKKSFKTMKETLEYLSKFFSNFVDFQFCSMDYVGKALKNQEDLFVTFRELQPYFEETLDAFEKEKNNCGRRLTIYETPLCAVDPYYWKYYISHNKTLSTYIAPNDESLYNKSENVISECNTNYKECKNCDVKEYCSGLWQSSYEIGKKEKDFLNPIKVLKNK